MKPKEESWKVCTIKINIKMYNETWGLVYTAVISLCKRRMGIKFEDILCLK